MTSQQLLLYGGFMLYGFAFGGWWGYRKTGPQVGEFYEKIYANLPVEDKVTYNRILNSHKNDQWFGHIMSGLPDQKPAYRIGPSYPMDPNRAAKLLDDGEASGKLFNKIIEISALQETSEGNEVNKELDYSIAEILEESSLARRSESPVEIYNNIDFNCLIIDILFLTI